jgi:hypothetical protein
MKPVESSDTNHAALTPPLASARQLGSGCTACATFPISTESAAATGPKGNEGAEGFETCPRTPGRSQTRLHGVHLPCRSWSRSCDLPRLRGTSHANRSGRSDSWCGSGGRPSCSAGTDEFDIAWGAARRGDSAAATSLLLRPYGRGQSADGATRSPASHLSASRAAGVASWRSRQRPCAAAARRRRPFHAHFTRHLRSATGLGNGAELGLPLVRAHLMHVSNLRRRSLAVLLRAPAAMPSLLPARAVSLPGMPARWSQAL